MGDVFAFSLNISYIVSRVFVCQMIQTKQKGCAMKKKLIIFMLLLGSSSIKAMEDFGEDLDADKVDCNSTIITTHKTTHKTKRNRRKKVYGWSSELGFETDNYSDQCFEMSIKPSGKKNMKIQCTGNLKIPLDDEEFLSRFLIWLTRIDPRNMDKGRTKAFSKILRMPTTPEAKLSTVYAQKLYRKNEIPPWLLMFTYMEVITGTKEKLFDSTNRRARKRYKLERRSSRASFQADKALQKAIEKIRDNS